MGVFFVRSKPCLKFINRTIKIVVSVRYFLMLRVHVRIVQNNQQIKELQAAYKIRKQFDISLNGTYVKL